MELHSVLLPLQRVKICANDEGVLGTGKERPTEVPAFILEQSALNVEFLFVVS